MKPIAAFLTTAVLLGTLVLTPALAQDATDNFREQFNRHFDYASRVLSLARAMPADKFSWRPGKGVSSFEEVCMHIARYNYYLPNRALDVTVPEGIDLETMESVTGKERVVAMLDRSIDHVKAAVEQMPDARFSEPAQMYGRTVNGQAVLLQLLTHLSEHVGQLIAYARVNGVVPPWSR